MLAFGRTACPSRTACPGRHASSNKSAVPWQVTCPARCCMTQPACMPWQSCMPWQICLPAAELYVLPEVLCCGRRPWQNCRARVCKCRGGSQQGASWRRAATMRNAAGGLRCRAGLVGATALCLTSSSCMQPGTTGWQTAKLSTAPSQQSQRCLPSLAWFRSRDYMHLANKTHSAQTPYALCCLLCYWLQVTRLSINCSWNNLSACAVLCTVMSC